MQKMRKKAEIIFQIKMKPVVLKNKTIKVYEHKTLTRLLREGESRWRCSGTNYSVGRPPLVMLMQYFPPCIFTRLNPAQGETPKWIL